MRRDTAWGSACSRAVSSSTRRMRALSIVSFPVSHIIRTGKLNEKVRSFPFVLCDENRSPVLFDDAVGNGKPKAGSRADLLGRKEGVENTLFQFGRDTWSGVAHANLYQIGLEVACDRNHFTRDRSQRIAGVGQQVDEDLLQLNSIADHEHLSFGYLDAYLDLPQAQVFLHVGERAPDDVDDLDRFMSDRIHTPKGTQVGANLGCLTYLLHGAVKFTENTLLAAAVCAQFNA